MLVTSCTSVNFFSCLLHFNSLAVFQFLYKNSLCKIHTNVSAVNKSDFLRYESCSSILYDIESFSKLWKLFHLQGLNILFSSTVGVYVYI